MGDIQNAAAGEQRIRDLNDKINDLLKEKRRWESRIRQLGGQDFAKNSSQALDAEGLYLPGSDDYKYFGAAKDLPRVRELFDKDKPMAPSKNYEDLNRKVGYDYFSNKLTDELLAEEQKLEKKLRKIAIDKYNLKKKEFLWSKKRRKIGENEEDDKNIEGSIDSDDEEFEDIHAHNSMSLATKNQIDVKVTADEIKKLILQKKKEALIKKYASEALDEKKQDSNLKIIHE